MPTGTCDMFMTCHTLASNTRWRYKRAVQPLDHFSALGSHLSLSRFIMSHTGHSASDEENSSIGKRSRSNALQLGPRKRQYVVKTISRIIYSNCHRTVQDPLVHHGRHFGRVVHAFCNVQTLLTNGMTIMAELEERGLETFTQE